LTQQRLGWTPAGIDLIADIGQVTSRLEVVEHSLECRAAGRR
jgi:hypothetical protein